MTSWAFEMETIVLGWYVMVHTGSVLLLTAFGSLQFLGTLAAPMFGVLGDRVGARLMLCTMRAIYAGLAALMILLGFADLLGPGWVFLVAGLNGIFRPNAGRRWRTRARRRAAGRPAGPRASLRGSGPRAGAS